MPILREKGAFRLQVGVNVGAAKAVDRLLGIPDQKQAARAQRSGGPGLAFRSLAA